MEFLQFFYYFSSFVVMVMCIIDYFRVMQKIDQAELFIKTLINVLITQENILDNREEK